MLIHDNYNKYIIFNKYKITINIIIINSYHADKPFRSIQTLNMIQKYFKMSLN